MPEFRRTGEIEEWSNRYLIHPLSERVARWSARRNIHPNWISILGMVLGAGAGVAYYHFEYSVAVFAGLLLMLGWHVMDGADGQLARLTGRTSEIGKVLDGLCDHVTFGAVYVGLTAALLPSMGTAAWILVALAGVSHVVQATAYEFQRQSYDFWGHAKASARVPGPDEIASSLRERRGVSRAFGVLHLAYVRIQAHTAGFDATLQTGLERSVSNGTDGERVRAAYRSNYRDAVRKWSVLSSNYRTVAVFVACLLGGPHFFLLFEILVLNAALLGLLFMQHRRNVKMRSWLVEHARVGLTAY